VRCELAQGLVECYFDGELSEHHAATYERHLQYCVDCSVALVEQELLSHRLQVAQLYRYAPVKLTQKIRGDLRSVSLGGLRSPTLLWLWFAVAGALLLILVTMSKVGPAFRSRGYASELAGDLIDMHQHSRSQGQMIGIASNNEQVVRQWFYDRVNFDLPVRNYANEGFALQGGRLDEIEGRSVAAVVYEGRGHLINVFMWPTKERDKSPHAGSFGVYQWIYWRKHEVEFCVVSDGAHSELERLYRLISE
jgi:anti-sigma factor RsiW